VRYQLSASTWGKEEVEVAHEVISSGKTTMGEKVAKFESEFAEYIGTNHAVMVNSGSSANLLLLAGLKYMRGSKIKDDDEIIVPVVSWGTTYYPIHQLGFGLKFVDINRDTLNIDHQKLPSIISKKTRAIFCVNLLGNSCEYDKIQEIAEENDLLIIEDNCESLGGNFNGSKLGGMGIGASHSFFFSHHICTMEGGAVTTNSQELMEAMKSIRAHGWLRDLPKINTVFNKSDDPWDDLFKFALPGYNLRPLEVEAAIGTVQLEKLPRFIDQRRQNALHFKNTIGQVAGIRTQKEVGESSWFGFSMILEGPLKFKRKVILEAFRNHQIESRPIVAGNFTRNPVIKHLRTSEITNYPVADEVHDYGLFLGNSHLDLRREISLAHEIILGI
jgi:CDP-6-deoxy-D-xylo-4-hexulose-3-dehydrase